MKIIKNLLLIIFFGIFLLFGYWSINVMNKALDLFQEYNSNVIIANACNEGVTVLYKMASELQSNKSIPDSNTLEFRQEALWYFGTCNELIDNNDQQLTDLNKTINKSLSKMNSILDSNETEIVDIEEILKNIHTIEENVIEMKESILSNSLESRFFKVILDNKIKVLTVGILGVFVFIAIMIFCNLKGKKTNAQQMPIT